ncbi:MAG: FtsQ-type POTRA domain-containing protein [Proteobacteria bacterium]|nr:FtsQ-type POTRA domain-containing protein [Pseudomonadota bacterium]MBU1686319.1 FtsQ-type POTRA domain-containing protein [Pseudomonadota bacterium]
MGMRSGRGGRIGKRWQGRRGGDDRGKVWRRGLVMLVGGGLAVLALIGGGVLMYQGLSRAPFFRIVDVGINGNKRIDFQSLRLLSGVDIHSNLIAIDPDQVKARLESHPWVEKAQVKRDWPDRLDITVEERNPVALINKADGLHYIDRQGTVFAPAGDRDDLDFPVISGIVDCREGCAEREMELEEALQFLYLAGLGNPNLMALNISEVHFSPEREMTVFLVDRPFPIKFGTGSVRKKYQQLTRVLGRLYKRRDFAITASIDMEYLSEKVLVGFERSIVD